MSFVITQMLLHLQRTYTEGVTLVFVKEYSEYLPQFFLSAVGFNLLESNISRTIQLT
jgi:hypothetical protein